MSACPFCAMHNHGRCRDSGCACAARAHVPDVDTAAAMRSYENPTEHRDAPEQRAARWHRKDERR